MRMLVLVLVVVLLWGTIAAAVEDIGVEEDIAELLSAPVEGTSMEARSWAVLPQVGYGPDTGPLGGVKFEDRDIEGSGVTVDVNGTYAVQKQQSFTLGIGSPHLLHDHALVMFRARYENDPEREFFGVGNNDVGPDPASTNSWQRSDADLIFGWRPVPRLAVTLGMTWRQVRIGHGDRRNAETPFTVDAFPDLPGIDGGLVNPVRFALVWSTRDSPLIPTRGWRAILQVSHTNRSLLSDFEFTRYVGDLGWVGTVGRHTVGIRADVAYVDGPSSGVPFWELEELGGDDTLRGFFPHRFLGKVRTLINGEYRVRLTTFDFYRLWRVNLYGVLFGEGGRVFISRSQVESTFPLNADLISQIVDSLEYSYGLGIRIALSQAIVARIDVGFSNEETGLVYLAFGQTF